MAALAMCALIWGTSYIAQILGMQSIGSLTFCASRYAISFTVLALAIALADRRSGLRLRTTDERRAETCRTVTRGVICGTVLFAGSILQQHGLLYTTAGKAAFITATFIVIVPVYGIFTGKIPSRAAISAIVMSMCGLYMLSIKEKDGFSMGRGDLLIFCGAFFWAAHIIACSAFARKSDPVKLSAVQFGTVAMWSIAGALLFERPNFASIAASWPPVIYAGLICTCVAYTFQMAAQRYVQPLTTSIIMSTESIFAAFFGYIVLGETLSARELIGCAVLFVATLLAQADDLRNGNFA